MQRILSVLGVCFLAFGGVALAQHRHQMGPGPMPRYDVSKETTVKGTISKVEQLSDCAGCDCPGCGGGTHIVLAPSSLEVHLGPTAFLKDKGWQFTDGEEVEIVGSEVELSGTKVLLAREIHRGGETLTLRDEKGFPLWSGKR